jgi:molecular chaperone GrpE
VGLRKKLQKFMSDKSKQDDLDKDKSNMGDKEAAMQDGSTENGENQDNEAQSEADLSQGSDLMSEVLNSIKSEAGVFESGEESGLSDADSEEPLMQELALKRQEIEGLKREMAGSQDKYLRALADFENFKKRSLKERADLLKYQGEQLVQDLVRVIDDLELALSFSGSAEAAADSESAKFVEGIKMINKNFVDTLAKWGIRAESAVGEQFDPQKHMAISKVSVPDASPGTVVSELKKVYFYKDKILRVAEVVVAAE